MPFLTAPITNSHSSSAAGTFRLRSAGLRRGRQVERL
jgi:hypothetical protein